MRAATNLDDRLALVRAAAASDVEVVALTADLPAADTPASCELHALRAMALFRRSAFSAAVGHALQALEGQHQLGDAVGECRQARMLAFLLAEHGLHERALAFAQRDFDTAEQAGLVDEATRAMARVGTLCGRLGQFDLGETLLAQAVSRARESGHESELRQMVNALLALHNDALAAYRRSGDEPRAAATGQRALRQGRYLLALAASESQPYALAVQIGSAAQALMDAGELAEARMHLERALVLAQQHDFPLLVLRAQLRLAHWHLQSGQLTEAAAHADGMAQGLRSSAHPGAAEDLLALRTDIARRRGDVTAAADLDRQALALRDASASRAAQLQAALGPETVQMPDRLLQLERRLAGSLLATR